MWFSAGRTDRLGSGSRAQQPSRGPSPDQSSTGRNPADASSEAGLIYIGPRTTTEGVLLFFACSDSESSAWQACEEEEGEAEGRGQNSVVTQGWNASL